ncbi:MAG: methionyl-tRNA formyltransferase [Lentisphaeria bacterium]|nr:methionyl-tRNA formyltransferase [Lentisphaeria bacterium]
MKTLLIGSVGSSKVVLQAMIETNFPITHVFSLDEVVSANVSGYYPIHEIAESRGIPFTKFKKINDEENVSIIKSIAPDYIFVVGLSQLVSREIIKCAKLGVIGFHPTPLPKMRGRAANVWQVLLGVHETKCSMFFIDDGMDSGDILGQEDYVIEDSDYAMDIYRKIEEATYRLSKRVLQEIVDGTLNPVKQNEEEATYLLKRSPEDGEIDWNEPIATIHRLIRAVSRPFPGAFGMYDGKHKFIIWRADIRENTKYIGMNGQIARLGADGIDVVCRDGLLHVTEYENVDSVKIFAGHKLR